MRYTAAQIKALAAALALATEAIQEMGKAQLPLSVPYVLDGEASLFRAQHASSAFGIGDSVHRRIGSSSTERAFRLASNRLQRRM